MRKLADQKRIAAFMRALSERARDDSRLYFTGGATAVLLGWRATTIDVDILLVPDEDTLRAVPELKDRLQVNVELACPADFIPPLPGWEDRSLYIERQGKLSFFHYDLYAQCLAKIERDHAQDRLDVQEMIRRGLVEPAMLLELLAKIEPNLYRYPAIDPASFRRSVEAIVADLSGAGSAFD